MTTTPTGDTRPVTLNGEPTEVPAGSVRDLLCTLDHDPEQGGIAVAVNGAVVPRSEWDTTTIRSGDQIEIVGARQGG